MFDKKFVTDAITRSSENAFDRRNFLTAAGVAGAGIGAATLLGGAAAHADDPYQVSDGAILNFALNLEYLEAEFYRHAVYGSSLPSSLTGGTGTLGGVSGGHAVPWRTPALKKIAAEIAGDEENHVTFLRGALGSAAVSRPSIDLKASFTAAAQAAHLIKKGQTFDPFASEAAFLLGSFIFEDVGVTAYKGAAPLVTNKTYLGAAAGILAVEAYHAGIIRTLILEAGLANDADMISDARDSLDGSTNDDVGVAYGSKLTLIPGDKNSIAFGRTAARVLNIAYLNPNSVTKGGFFPAGVNGTINTSGAPGDPTS